MDVTLYENFVILPFYFSFVLNSLSVHHFFFYSIFRYSFPVLFFFLVLITQFFIYCNPIIGQKEKDIEYYLLGFGGPVA